MPSIGELQQAMKGARQTIAVTITFRKSNKNLLEPQTGTNRSSGWGDTL